MDAGMEGWSSVMIGVLAADRLTNRPLVDDIKSYHDMMCQLSFTSIYSLIVYFYVETHDL